MKLFLRQDIAPNVCFPSDVFLSVGRIRPEKTPSDTKFGIVSERTWEWYVRVEFPWKKIRRYYDANTFYMMEGPCRKVLAIKCFYDGLTSVKDAYTSYWRITKFLGWVQTNDGTAQRVQHEERHAPTI